MTLKRLFIALACLSITAGACSGTDADETADTSTLSAQQESASQETAAPGEGNENILAGRPVVVVNNSLRPTCDNTVAIADPFTLETYTVLHESALLTDADSIARADLGKPQTRDFVVSVAGVLPDGDLRYVFASEVFGGATVLGEVPATVRMAVTVADHLRRLEPDTKVLLTFTRSGGSVAVVEDANGTAFATCGNDHTEALEAFRQRHTEHDRASGIDVLLDLLEPNSEAVASLRSDMEPVVVAWTDQDPALRAFDPDQTPAAIDVG